jgi:hypothetical protein
MMMYSCLGISVVTSYAAGTMDCSGRIADWEAKRWKTIPMTTPKKRLRCLSEAECVVETIKTANSRHIVGLVSILDSLLRGLMVAARPINGTNGSRHAFSRFADRPLAVDSS